MICNSPSSRGRNTKASSGLPTLNNSASDRTNFGYSDSVNGIVTGKGPIGHRRLTNQKMLDLPGYGAVLAAVPDISKCNERDILQAIGFTQKGDRSLKEKAAIGREGSKQLEAARNREGLENFDGRDFR